MRRHKGKVVVTVEGRPAIEIRRVSDAIPEEILVSVGLIVGQMVNSQVNSGDAE